MMPRTRRVSPGRQSGTCGSECRHGHDGLPQARTQGCHAEMIHRLPDVSRQAAKGAVKILLGLVDCSKPASPFSMTHICTCKPVSFSVEPLVTAKLICTWSLPG